MMFATSEILKQRVQQEIATPCETVTFCVRFEKAFKDVLNVILGKSLYFH